MRSELARALGACGVVLLTHSFAWAQSEPAPESPVTEPSEDPRAQPSEAPLSEEPANVPEMSAPAAEGDSAADGESEAPKDAGKLDPSADPRPPPPPGGFQVRREEPNYSDEELRELADLQKKANEFEKEAEEFRQATRAMIERKYNERRKMLFESYEKRILELEAEQRKRREDAIAKFQAFVAKYPDHPKYTPDAMFRLSELLFERSYDEYLQERNAYDEAMVTWEPDSGEPEPMEPFVAYEPTIAMMQRLITEFPGYRLIDGSYYLLGYCLGEQGEEDRAVEVFEELVIRYPESRFGSEVWTRIGEYYFNNNELNKALTAYTQVLNDEESVFYDKAMYKLAWTHYRLADPDTAPQEFRAAVDTFVRLLDFNERTKKEGKERGGELRPESIQYIAISFADENWGGADKLAAYFEEIGPRPYERDIWVALGDVYFDQTRYQDSINVYARVQRDYPNDSTAPQIQEKMITAYERDRDFEGAALARADFTERFTDGSKWYQANENDEEAIRESEKLLSKALYSAALFHHQQAQVMRDAGKYELATQEYGKAAAAYGSYLERFPHDRQLYELTYYHADTLYYSFQFLDAAQRYREVRDSNADDKFREDAAFSVVLAYEKAIELQEREGTLEPRPVRKSTERSPDEDLSPKEIPEIKLKLVAASDRYSAVAPNSERVPKVLYKAAETYYVYDHFDEARRRFESLIEGFSQDEVSEYASNLVIESYLTQGNYAAVEDFTRGLLASGTPGRRGNFKDDLVKFKSGAMFKIADELAASGQYEKAAGTYLSILEENPDNEFADSALNNAAVAYEKVQRYDSASKLYKRLVEEHPDSTLADNALFRVGLNAERFFNLDKATDSYLRLIKKYPKSPRRADAIYNAALALENTQRYDEAATQYQRYCKLFPDREDAPQVCFRAGVVYEKMEQPRRVISTYETFIRKYRNKPQHSDRIVEAYLKLAKANNEIGRSRDASRAYRDAVNVYQKEKNPAATPFAAEAQFQLVELEFEKFNKVTITGNTTQQKRSIEKKAKLLKEIEGKYGEILGFKQVDWTMASLYRVGNLYQNFANSIVAAPCPQEIKRQARSLGMTKEEVCDEYRILLEEQSFTIEDKAVAAYETTITKARELQVKNEWTKKTLVALNKLRRAQWPLQKDAKLYVDAEPVPAPPLLAPDGAGLFLAPESAAPEPAPEPAPKAPEPEVDEKEQPKDAPPAPSEKKTTPVAQSPGDE